MVALFVNVAGRFGINAKEAERFFKFAVVGVIGFVVDFGVSNLLLIPFDNGLQEGRPLHAFVARFTAIPEDQALLFAGTISFICAIISNFIWNNFTFSHLFESVHEVIVTLYTFNYFPWCF